MTDISNDGDNDTVNDEKLYPDLPVNTPSSTVINQSARVMDHYGYEPPPQSKTPVDVQAKLSSVKVWGVSTFKCAKQLLSEKLGKGTRTTDVELEGRVEQLRETKKSYGRMLALTRALQNHMFNVVQTQRGLADIFRDLGQRSLELTDEFNENSENQQAIVKNGEVLLNALSFFNQSLHTLTSKTIDDTMQTIKTFEMTRLEFDCYRCELEAARQDITPSKHNIPELEEKCADLKTKYEQQRKDVDIKLQFLDENRLKVMRKELILFNSAVSAYFSGNAKDLQKTISQFTITPTAIHSSKTSFLNNF